MLEVTLNRAEWVRTVKSLAALPHFNCSAGVLPVVSVVELRHHFPPPPGRQIRRRKYGEIGLVCCSLVRQKPQLLSLL